MNAVTKSPAIESCSSIDSICLKIKKLADPNSRRTVLVELLRCRESTPDFACYLWYSFGTITVILGEIISIYPHLANANVSHAQSHQICGCLTLLQCVASHPETKEQFIKANLPLYLYPFLSTTPSSSKAIEFLRLTALGVLGAMVKGESPVVLRFLLQSEIIPLCLRTMETCNELPRNVSTFILQKVLLSDEGLAFMCSTPEKYFAITTVLGRMIESSGKDISGRLLKHVMRCYLRLAENSCALQSLPTTLPQHLLTALDTGYYDHIIQQDPAIHTSIRALIDLVQQMNFKTNSAAE